MSISVQNSSSPDLFQSVQARQPDYDIANAASPPPKRDTISLNRESGESQAGGYGDERGLTTDLRRVDLFIKAVSKAGDHKGFFSSLAHSLRDDGDLQVAFHEFSAGLSAEDLDSFLTALEKDPDSLKQFMGLASRLSGEALSPFLEGAALAGEDVDGYLESVSRVLDGETGESFSFQYTFLAAGVEQGNDIMAFINRLEKMSLETLEAVARFADDELGNPYGRNEEMNLFAAVFGSANEKNLQDLTALATGLADEDQTHLLKAASGADNGELDRLLQQAERYAGGDGAALSDYLAVASDAEGRLDTFMALADSLDLSAIREFSVVDTANLLDAAHAGPTGLKTSPAWAGPSPEQTGVTFSMPRQTPRKMWTGCWKMPGRFPAGICPAISWARQTRERRPGIPPFS